MGSGERHLNVSLIVRGKDSVHKLQLLKTRAEAESNRGPSAWQPNALPLGQTDRPWDWEDFRMHFSQALEIVCRHRTQVVLARIYSKVILHFPWNREIGLATKQLDSQLSSHPVSQRYVRIIPKPTSHPWYCHVSTTVTLCCQECPTAHRQNQMVKRIVLSDSFSRPLNAFMLRHSWLDLMLLHKLYAAVDFSVLMFT